MLPVHYKVKLNQFAINQCWVYLLHNNSFFSKNMDFEMFEIQHITEQLDKLLPDKKKSSITQLLLPPKKLFFLTVQFYTYFSIDIGSTTLTSSKKRRCSNPRGVWCHFHRGFTPRNNNNKIQLFYRFSQIIKLLRSRKNPTYSRICAWVLHTASTYYFFGLSTIVFSCFCAVFAQFQKKKTPSFL